MFGKIRQSHFEEKDEISARIPSLKNEKGADFKIEMQTTTQKVLLKSH